MQGVGPLQVEWRSRGLWKIPKLPDRGEKEVRRMLAHVLDRLDHVGVLARVLRQRGRREGEEEPYPYWDPERHVSDALIEAYLVGARALAEFLWADQRLPEDRRHRRPGERLLYPREDDVFAFEFVKDPEGWLAGRPERSSALTGTYERINGTYIHLNWGRFQQERYEGHAHDQEIQYWQVLWGDEAPLAGLQEALNHFIDNLLPGLASDRQLALARMHANDFTYAVDKKEKALERVIKFHSNGK